MKKNVSLHLLAESKALYLKKTAWQQKLNREDIIQSSSYTAFLWVAGKKQISEVDEKPFTSSLNIYVQRLYSKKNMVYGYGTLCWS
jgi:hypothetical protein